MIAVAVAIALAIGAPPAGVAILVIIGVIIVLVAQLARVGAGFRGAGLTANLRVLDGRELRAGNGGHPDPHLTANLAVSPVGGNSGPD